VEACGVKASAHEGKVAERVELTEHANAIDHDDIRTARRCVVESRACVRGAPAPFHDAVDVVLRWLMRGDDQSGSDPASTKRIERRKEHGFIRGPG
jgi:hypothetical protein